ncbi:hypothetical protein ACFLV3_03230 [Chloroflexota bacterium]
MNNNWFNQLLQVTVFALALAAVFQEMEKTPEERKWHGKVAGLVPYDFRIPTIEKFKDAYWNPYETRVLTPRVFGIGWGINFYALLENLGLMEEEDGSEEDFLMPTPSIKEVLKEALTEE